MWQCKKWLLFHLENKCRQLNLTIAFSLLCGIRQGVGSKRGLPTEIQK